MGGMFFGRPDSNALRKGNRVEELGINAWLS